ncbi:hypothetical protein M7I_7257 [Glarea lozoyensis 74030]|uniref:Uncharacterized protein n=1 Tax=Glarea lozoyensis (strain ATCC 74030 / MF5533) TaxID=1104152 RepID=H0EWT3_GLAL7|nr:hypothetical protein M7I_7257 [Glarea lozoyensis 74030]
MREVLPTRDRFFVDFLNFTLIKVYNLGLIDVCLGTASTGDSVARTVTAAGTGTGDGVPTADTENGVATTSTDDYITAGNSIAASGHDVATAGDCVAAGTDIGAGNDYAVTKSPNIAISCTDRSVANGGTGVACADTEDDVSTAGTATAAGRPEARAGTRPYTGSQSRSSSGPCGGRIGITFNKDFHLIGIVNIFKIIDHFHSGDQVIAYCRIRG